MQEQYNENLTERPDNNDSQIEEYKNEKLQQNTQIKENNQETQENSHKRAQKRGIIAGLTIATAVLGITTLGFSIGWGVEMANRQHFQTTLENVYNDNFYNLLDSVNNLENKVSKTLSATGGTYVRKTLLEASKNASEAGISLSALPLSGQDLEDTARAVNQVSGYTSILAEKLAMGEKLSKQENESLAKIHTYLLNLKEQLNRFERRMEEGYSILDGALEINGEGNGFSRTISGLKSVDIQYPTMIYDGPFSDSVVNSEIKGLQGETVSRERAREELAKHFKQASDIADEGETNGRFATYNFRVKNSDDEILFAQVTKIGGNVLTISGTTKEGEKNVEYSQLRKVAIDFASENGIENPDVVWADWIENDLYLNIAPTENGIVLYPDLVKVKLNATTGAVVGYDATAYFTNHTQRKLAKGSLSESTAVGYLPKNFEIIQSRWVLSPLDYNREVVCREVEAVGEDGKYYFYFNGTNGDLENVLKVVETDNGNLLM